MKQGTVAVYRSVDLVTRSRRVVELLQDEERKARQYNVLGEPNQLIEVNDTHLQIEKALESLLPANSDEKMIQLVEELKFKENYIIGILNSTAGEPEQIKEDKEQALSLYQDISSLAGSIVKLSNQLMIDEVEILRRKARRDKEKLIWQTSGLISFTIILIVVFMALISKPIKQINRGIERLGDGDFATPVNILWPRDLQILGEKLDWLRKRLAKLDKEKIKLITHISHDLKTPLASIKEGASVLHDELAGPMSDEQKEIVGILDKNCSKLQRLIENILNFNRAQSRDSLLEKSRIKLNKLIEAVLLDHQNSVLARSIKLEAQLDAVEVSGNQKQLKTVFDNLLSNAVKFTPDEGHIKIRLRSEGKFATCIVEDNGPGIDEEDRPRIFSPFYKGKGSGKSVIKGSGLGLAISKEYVQNHEGTIRLLDSKNGARFLVTLPIMG
jgi:two-component system sensor histidine kinase GlrK